MGRVYGSDFSSISNVANYKLKIFFYVSLFLTWTVPLRAALVSVDKYGKAK